MWVFEGGHFSLPEAETAHAKTHAYTCACVNVTCLCVQVHTSVFRT